MVIPLPNGDVDISMLKEAVELIDGKFETEASCICIFISLMVVQPLRQPKLRSSSIYFALAVKSLKGFNFSQMDNIYGIWKSISFQVFRYKKFVN